MKYKSNIKSIDSVINEKAALWVWKCDSGLTIEEQSEFNQWLESNETNKKTFNELNNLLEISFNSWLKSSISWAFFMN